MNRPKQCIVTIIFALACGGCVNVLKHNEVVAADRAVEFAKAAIVERNYEKASKLLPEGGQQPEFVKQIEDLVIKAHPASYPTKVTAKEFEPIPGQKAIRIFLIGENGKDEKFYYSFMLTGTVDEGYRVAEIYRYKDSFPASQTRKPLSVQKSTDN